MLDSGWTNVLRCVFKVYFSGNTSKVVQVLTVLQFHIPLPNYCSYFKTHKDIECK